jgi:hypothetical protein
LTNDNETPTVRDLVEQAYKAAIYNQASDTDAQADAFRVLVGLASQGDARVLDVREQQLKAEFLQRFGADLTPAPAPAEGEAAEQMMGAAGAAAREEREA